MKIEGHYRFKVGDFECVSISDGGHKYPLQSVFANVPIKQVEAVLRQRNLPTDYVWTPYTYLYVNTGENRVLVDVGAGSLFETTGKLLQNMEAAGIESTAIDSVFITHAHPDHVGGMLDESGNPVYANAQYFIWGEEWQFWFSETASEKASKLPRRKRRGFVRRVARVLCQNSRFCPVSSDSWYSMYRLIISEVM